MLQIEPKRIPFFLTDDYELFDNSPIKSRNCFPFSRIQSRLWTAIWLTGGYMASRSPSDLTCDFHLHVLEASTCMNKVWWSPSPRVRAPKEGSKTRAEGAGIAWTQRLCRTPCRPDSYQTPSLTPFQVPPGQENNHPGSVWSCVPQATVQCKKRAIIWRIVVCKAADSGSCHHHVSYFSGSYCQHQGGGDDGANITSYYQRLLVPGKRLLVYLVFISQPQLVFWPWRLELRLA